MVKVLPPLKIVYASPWFGSQKFSKDEEIGKTCRIPEGYTFNLTENKSWCTITSDKEELDKATGIIMHAPDMNFHNLPPHKENQPWILETLESPFSSAFRSDKAYMEDFNYLASYHMRSSFYFSYFSSSILDVVNRPLPKEFMKTKRKGAPILWIAKNCRATNGREYYIEKLAEYITVDSYGECLNNKEFPNDTSRMELMAEYKFYLSVENSNCDDYVTEKLYDTLSMSAVPIVDGPSSYKGYVPTERSIIYMDAYPDPKDLADYINYLDGNDTAYLEYLSFRRDAIDISAKDRLEPTFLANWSDTLSFNERSSYCSVCRGLIPWWVAKQEGRTYVEQNKDLFLVDDTCASAGKWNYIKEGPPYQPDWIPRLPDEFTRPNFHSSSDNQSLNKVLDKSTSVFVANLSFVLIFFVFISVLIRESKKSHYHCEMNV